MSVKIVESFSRGDHVPNWLLALESLTGSTYSGYLVFGADCAVIETSSGYHIVILGDPRQGSILVAHSGEGDHRIIAPTRTVFLPESLNVYEGNDELIASLGST